MSAYELSLLSNRMLRASALDASMYEEVEADPTAGGQAALVVVLSSVAAGIGAGGWHGAGLRTFALFTAIALATWMAWAWLVAEIGRRVVPEPQTQTSFGELLRTLGFAATPGLLQVFAAMPAMIVPVFAITGVWMLAAMVVAVRQALDYRHTSRAVAVCALAGLLALVMAFGLGILFGPTVA
jgi:hypothetical protein